MPFLTILLPLAVVFQYLLAQSNTVADNITPKIQKDIVDQHNAIRRTVNPPASNMLKMIWDTEAGKTAKKWVSQCKEGSSPKEERIVKGIPCGENVYEASHPTSWRKVIEFWSAKASSFRYGYGLIGDINARDIYTQMIWYNSNRIGCATAICPKNALTPFRYICHYCPVGNTAALMKKPYKPGKPCEECPHSCDNQLCTNPCKYTDAINGCDVLAKMSSCNEKLMETKCQATCKCKTEIK